MSNKFSTNIRSVFDTNTGKSATVASIAGLIVVICPFVSNIVKRHVNAQIKHDVEDVTQIVLALSGILATTGGGLALINRASAVDKVYSPDWLPGFDKKDLIVDIESTVKLPNLGEK
jgi:ABC-type Fe3+ transport system permease subunit